MKQMVIACFPDGTVQHTLKDELFNPFPDQRRKIERMSEILFDEAEQAFYVKFIKGPFKGQVLDAALMVLYGAVAAAPWTRVDDKVFFKSYAGAVAAEIEVINEMRLKGHRFDD